MTPLVAYLLLFVAVGAGFIFVHLMAGKFIRPSKMDAEKGTIYECGEPTIGSAWVQFDLRFYVVALLFVIFDVEVAFFFPWAEVFGRANALAATPRPADGDAAALANYGRQVLQFIPPYPQNDRDRERYSDLRELSLEEYNQRKGEARTFAWLAFGEIVIFFGVLLVGFAYLWKRGDLAWVRSVAAERQASLPPTPPLPPPAPAPAPRPLAEVGAPH